MIEERKFRFAEYLRGELTLTLAFAMFAALLLGLLFVPLSLAQQQDSATPERADGAPLSRNFTAKGLRASELLRDWQQHIAFTFENGYPLSEASIFSDRDRAADALGRAAMAASNAADRAALQQLRNLFASLQQWSDGLVEDKRNLRLASYYMSPTGVEDDPVFQKNTKCATSIAEMLLSKQLAEIPSCQL
jgi:hypothetical protein